MNRSRWWTLIAVLALVPVAVRSRADAPQGVKIKCAARCPQPSGRKLIQKSYPVADLIRTLNEEASGSRLLVRAVTCAVKPTSWSVRGGRGTIEYVPEAKALVINQTADVHEGVEAVLKALVAIQAKPHGIQPITRAAYSAPSGQLKQYGHFVLDNVKVNAMGVSCTIKRIRFMYKGDGIDADVAKCALTNGESEKKADVPRVLADLLEKVGKEDKSTGTLLGGAIGAIGGNVIGKGNGAGCQTPATLPPSAACIAEGEIDPVVEHQGKADKAEAKKSSSKLKKGKAKPE